MNFNLRPDKTRVTLVVQEFWINECWHWAKYCWHQIFSLQSRWGSATLSRTEIEDEVPVQQFICCDGFQFCACRCLDCNSGTVRPRILRIAWLIRSIVFDQALTLWANESRKTSRLTVHHCHSKVIGVEPWRTIVNLRRVCRKKIWWDSLTVRAHVSLAPGSGMAQESNKAFDDWSMRQCLAIFQKKSSAHLQSSWWYLELYSRVIKTYIVVSDASKVLRTTRFLQKRRRH
jgi:hypothetical protein